MFSDPVKSAGGVRRMLVPSRFKVTHDRAGSVEKLVIVSPVWFRYMARLTSTAWPCITTTGWTAAGDEVEAAGAVALALERETGKDVMPIPLLDCVAVELVLDKVSPEDNEGEADGTAEGKLDACCCDTLAVEEPTKVIPLLCVNSFVDAGVVVGRLPLVAPGLEGAT